MDDQVGQFVRADGAVAERLQHVVGARHSSWAMRRARLPDHDRGEGDLFCWTASLPAVLPNAAEDSSISGCRPRSGRPGRHVRRIAGEGGVPVLGRAGEDGAQPQAGAEQGRRSWRGEWFRATARRRLAFASRSATCRRSLRRPCHWRSRSSAIRRDLRSSGRRQLGQHLEGE
jgi:hypothetical protein